MASSKNLEFEKTSFLSKSNSAFIEQMYVKFINKDPNLPESWLNYFEGMGEELDVIVKEINGPSWSPAKKKVDIDEIQKNIADIGSINLASPEEYLERQNDLSSLIQQGESRKLELQKIMSELVEKSSNSEATVSYTHLTLPTN